MATRERRGQLLPMLSLVTVVEVPKGAELTFDYAGGWLSGNHAVGCLSTRVEED